MTIRGRFRLSLLVSVALIVCVSTILLVTSQQVNKAIERNRVADKIVRGVFELNILTSDYVLYRVERAEKQWRLKHETLGKLLANPPFHKPQERAFVRSIKGSHADMGRLFEQLVHSYYSTPLLKKESATALNQQLTAQLRQNSQTMVSGALRLVDRSQVDVLVLEQLAIVLVIAFTVVMVAVMAAISTIVSRSVLRPIVRLQEGTAVIGTGNLDYKMQFDTKDEIGDLSRAFNDMTEKLKGVTVSHDRLAREVSSRRRAEETLAHRAQELERSNADLRQFAYVASHDLQEPLRMVGSYTQLLAKRYQGKLDRDADEFIAYAVDGANRMRTLINDLLTYSRVGTRGKPFAPTSFQVVFDQALANLKVAIEETGAIVTHSSLPTLMGDETQLVQLLQNLIGNAIKFRRETPPSIHVSVEQKNHEWEFAIRDNGIGIEPEYAERIFMIFERLHRHDEYPGTGIGLAICKKIVERHGGRIWMMSDLGKGTTFHFTFPTAPLLPMAEKRC